MKRNVNSSVSFRDRVRSPKGVFFIVDHTHFLCFLGQGILPISRTVEPLDLPLGLCLPGA